VTHLLRPPALTIALWLAAALMAPSRTLAGPDVVPADLARVREEIERPGASAVLINVWATWCDPCREEMPDILRFYRESRGRGLRLVLVSADVAEDRGKAAAFLRGLGVDFVTFLKEGDDMAFIDGLDTAWSGALPASFLFDGAGVRRHTWSGKVTRAELRAQLDRLIGTPDSIEAQPKQKRRKP
jgi:thiol-disulfide isomerase/thioredoxin